MSTECANDCHQDCNAPPNTCSCGCHAAITAALETSLGATTTRALPPRHGSDSSELALHEREGRSWYAPPLDGGDLYRPTGPQSAFEQAGMLPHEIESVEDEQASRSIAAGRLRQLFSDTYKRAGLPVPTPFRVQRRPRGLLARLAGMIHLAGN